MEYDIYNFLSFLHNYNHEDSDKSFYLFVNMMMYNHLYNHSCTHLDKFLHILFYKNLCITMNNYHYKLLVAFVI